MRARRPRKSPRGRRRRLTPRLFSPPMRQTQGSMICPHCGKLISVSEEKCPFCGAWRPGLYGYSPLIQRWFGRFDFVAIITVACIVLYVLCLVVQPSAILGGGGGMFNF